MNRFHEQGAIPRVTGQYKIAGPITFRRACAKVFGRKQKKLEIANYGTNMQNWQKKMREIVKAPPGYLLVNRDQSGADAKIVAILCKDGRYRDLFRAGIKPHTYIALTYFHHAWATEMDRDRVDVALRTPILDLQKLDFWKQLAGLIKSSDDWAAKRRYYYFGKKVGHSGNYGLKGAKLVDIILEETQGEIVLEKATADGWLSKYLVELFPEIAMSFQFNVIREATTTKQLRNLLGFPFNITTPIRDNDTNDLLAWIPQSTVACINERALCEMQQYIQDNDKDWHIIAETHDSITMEVIETEAEEAASILGGYYKTIPLTSPVDQSEWRMETECQIGKNWYSYDKDKNPEGLREVKGI